jgi:hypothetical protein
MSTMKIKNLLEVSKQLDSKLVFAKFGELADHQRKLYSDYNEIDEPDEINRDWREFSATVVEHILSVAELTKSLFERIFDEIRRKDGEPSDDDFLRMTNITDFWLDLSIMSYLYTTIQKQGVLKQAPLKKKPKGYYRTKKYLDELTQIVFSKDEFFNKEARFTLFELLKLDQLRKRMILLEESEEKEEFLNDLLGEYDKGQAIFLLNIVRTRISEGVVSWWWKDVIAMHSTVEHGLFHLENMKESWSDTSSDFSMLAMDLYQQSFTRARLMSNAYLAQHFKRLGEEALRVGGLSVGSSYFKQAADMLIQTGEKSLIMLEKVDAWSKFSVYEQYVIYNITDKLSTVAAAYKSTIKHLEEENDGVIEIPLDEAIQNVNKSLSEGDITYLSSVALMFETVLVYIQESMPISSKKKRTEVLTFVNNRMKGLQDRLKTAAQNVATQWLRAVRTNPTDVDQLKSLIKNIELLQLAILIVPGDEKIKAALFHELEAIEYATDAIRLGQLANDEFGKNPVKELMIRAKAFHLVCDAIENCKDSFDSEIKDGIIDILDPVGLNSFLRGLIAEVQLRTSLLQYQFVNKIASIIENSALNKQGIVFPTYKYDIEQLKDFKESIDEIHIATSTIVKHQAPIQIKGQPVNWKYFNVVNANMEGLGPLIDVIILAIQGSQPPELVSKNNALTAWDEAKTLTFKVAETIGKAGGKDSEQIGQAIFSMAQAFSNIEANLRDNRKVEGFPIEFLLDILQRLIMGI